MLFALLQITLGQTTIGTERCDEKQVLYAQTQGCCLYQFNAEYTREMLAKKGTKLYNDITKCNPRPEDNYFLKDKTQYLPCGDKGSNFFNGNQNIVKVCRPLNILKADLEELFRLQANIKKIDGCSGPNREFRTFDILTYSMMRASCDSAWEAYENKRDEVLKRNKRSKRR